MPLLLGPCTLLAPLVLLVAILAIPLWPVALVVIGATWLVVWPIEHLLRALGVSAMQGWHTKIGRLFRTLLTPWTYFDPPSPPA